MYSAKAPNGKLVAVKVTSLADAEQSEVDGRVASYHNEVAQLSRLRKETKHVVVIYDFSFDRRLGEGFCSVHFS